MKRYLWPVVAFTLLLLGLILGFVVGRAILERQWSNPVTTIRPRDYERSSRDGADPTPAVGTRILTPLPLRRLRAVAAELIGKANLRIDLTSFGNGEDGASLHLMMKNNASCTITTYEGVAYAYDAHGRPTKANLAGENYISFASSTLEAKPAIAPGEKFIHEQKLKHPETASLGLAYIDRYTCADGTVWHRLGARYE
jgi:hypothetical protein